ncbi:MAG: AAA family ATPase [Alistipes sp.]|nr:AAA family ATPase [Alistipes sp.]
MHAPRKSLKSLCSEIEVWESWLNDYRKYVPRFIEEARTKTRWEDWDKEVFYNFFERARDHCVANLQQGYFSTADKQAILAHWDELAPLLRTVAENQTEPQWNVYRQIKNTIRKYTKRDMRAATHRLVASLQPNLLCTVVEESSLSELYKKLGRYTSDEIPGYTGGDWFRNSCGISRLYRSVLQPHDPTDIITYPWQMLEFFKEYDKRLNDMNEYVTAKKELLENVRNLIFTGAPGTGKTYLAKQIARMMTGAATDEELDRSGQFAFVQFHPSYDYTDFVEGLRPAKSDDGGSIGFELRDGVFKKFCAAAAANLADSRKSQEVISAERRFDKAYDGLIARIQDGAIAEIPLKSGTASMAVDSVSDKGNINLKTKGSDKVYLVSRERLRKLAAAFPSLEAVESVKNIYNEVTAVIGGCHSSAYWATLHYLYENTADADTADTTPVVEKKYVFLIDEINRGEISRIFGELFFSIDPGYRGPKGAVETQYSNMHDTGEKFYVPENVYIVGTMNDIDRSVESFDFAMRRRFTWDEITAAESAENMNLSPETRKVMTALNDAIAKVEGLNSSYCIGGAYFLDREGSEESDYEALWNYRLAPLLREYLRGMQDADTKFTEIEQVYHAAVANN